VRSLWAAGLLLRRLRSERGIILLIVVLVAATSTVFAAAPRLFNRAADAALQQALAVAPAVQRDVAMRRDTRLDPGEDPLGGARGYGDQVASQIPRSIAALVSDRLLIVTTVRLLLPEPPSFETHLSLRYQDGLAEATRLVAGRWPVDRGMPLRQLDLGGGAGEPGEPGEPGAEPLEPAEFEIAFSAAQAAELGVELGDRYAVVLDGSDPLLRVTAFRIGPAEVEVVGIFEPIDASAGFWSGDESLLAADIRGTEDEPIAFATAFFPAEAYPNLWSSELPFHYEWRFVVEPGRLDADQVPGLQADLPRLDRIGGGSAGQPGLVLVRTGLGAILERYVTERSLAEAVLSIAAIGPFALAAGALAMVAILLIRRRAAMLALVRGRGASGSLVLGTQLWEAIILAGGAALVGLAIAVAVVPARASPLSAFLAIAVGATTTLLLVGASWRTARRALGQTEREDAPAIRVAPRRLVIEGTIVAVAVAATLLLRQRGLVIAADGAGAAGADPFLASVPVLAGLAAGIVALRLYPLPIRGLGWLAARRRDLVPVLGLRTIGRRSGAANLPLLALMLTAAFGAFTSIVGSSLDRGQLVASYREIGADYRLEMIGSNTFTNVDPASIPGVEAAAAGLYDAAAPFAGTSRQRASVRLQAVDPPAYAAVTAGTPADPQWPLSFLAEPPPEGLGTEDNPLPAILSNRVPSGTTDLAPGDTFRMTVAGQAMTFRIVERRATFPGIDARVPFAVVPFTWVKAAHEDRTVLPTRLWLRGPTDVAQGVAAAIDGASGDARIVSRHAAYAALRGNSMGQAVIHGYALAVLIAAIYMALTIVGALIISAARRTRDLAYLRTLGVSAPQSLALTVMEHAPPVLLALVPGVALGIGVAVLVLPGLGLGTFAGTSGPVPLFVDAIALTILIAGLLGVVAVAVMAGTWLSRRARLVNALRMGED
jgi:putative ABC transport system permease protein